MVDRDVARRFFIPTLRKPPAPDPPGLYHYMREDDGTYTRFHLRIEPDGRGMLLVNASSAASLSASGVMMAKGLLDDLAKEEILATVKRSFRGASKVTIEDDFDQVKILVDSLASPGDNYPIINLEDPELSPYEVELMAPWQADILLSNSKETIPILDRLWEIGIPHVTIFIPLEYDPLELVRTIERAEDLGMIAGVRGRGTDLAADGLLDDLAMTGVDHITLLFASDNADLHDKLVGTGDHAKIAPLFTAIMEHEIAPVAEFPLTRRTLDRLESSLITLLEMDVTNVNFVAYGLPDHLAIESSEDYLRASSMPQVADIVEETASELEVRFIWQPPVGGDTKILLSKQIVEGPRCSDDASIRIEPNGDVLPPRGPREVAGNLLVDDWDVIWSHHAFQRYRERIEQPTRCDDCPGMAICAADCPRFESGWSTAEGGYD